MLHRYLISVRNSRGLKHSRTVFARNEWTAIEKYMFELPCHLWEESLTIVRLDTPFLIHEEEEPLEDDTIGLF